MSKKKVVCTFLVIAVVLSTVGFFFVSHAIKKEEKKLVDASPYQKKLQNGGMSNLPPAKYLNGYGARIFKGSGEFLEDMFLPIENNEINCFVSLANCNNAVDNGGLMVFIDGELQRFFVDGATNAELLHLINMPKDSLINVPVKFEPYVGKKSAPHNVWFLFLNTLDKKPTEKLSSYFSTPILKTLPALKKVSDQNIIKKDANCRLVGVDPKILTGGFFDASINELNSMSNLCQQITVNAFPESSKSSFRFDAYAQKEDRYITYFIINNKVAFVNGGKGAIEWESKPDKILSHKITFDQKLTPGEYTAFTITVSVNDSKITPKETRKCTLLVH